MRPVTALAMLLLTLPLHAARRVPSPPAFEVATIKANMSGQPQMVVRTPPSGTISAVNVTARFLIRFAYDITENRIVALPDWASRRHFDIVAKAPADSRMGDVRLMFRALLVERFGLRAHTGQQEMPADVLTVVNAGTIAPGLTPARARCDLRDPGCGVHLAFGRVTATDATIAEVAAALTVNTGRVVVDRTGLTGRYDLTLTYTPDALALQPSLGAEFPAVDPDGPSLATALEEQLGIRMRPTREPVDVLVIDSIAHPTAD